MEKMDAAHGRRRAVIRNVNPCVAYGEYPAKAVVHQVLKISADVFADGHDKPAASVFTRHRREKKWKEIPLQALGNDHWECTVIPDSTGLYEFQVQAWIDHFGTWKDGLKKKVAAGQDVGVELQIGLHMMQETAAQTKGKDKVALANFIAGVSHSTDMQAALAVLSESALSNIMNQWRPADLTTVSKVMKVEVERERAGFSTWYELFPRSAARQPGEHGTFNDVKKLLPRIVEMGFDVLYLPPIHPIGEVNRKGKNNSLHAGKDDPGSPWAIGNSSGGHTAIHPQLGSVKDFKSLVNAARKQGVEIALDIAYQCAPDHPYVKEHPEWFTWRPDGTVQYAENPPKKYEDILPFNFECDAWRNLWEELKNIILYWVEMGVTIFRIDNPHTKPFRFWEWMIGEVRRDYPEVIFLAEAFTRPRLMEQLAMAGFNQSYTYFAWRNTKSELISYIKELTRTEKQYYFRPNLWPNTPDILTKELVEGGGHAHIQKLILAATLSSNYGLYGPVYEFVENQPMPGKEEYNNNEKYEIRHWDWEAQTRVGEIITMVNKIRKENKALQSTNNIEFGESTGEHIICYAKADSDKENALIIAVNLDPHQLQGAHVKVPLATLGLAPDETYHVYDLLSGDRFTWKGEWNYVQLAPWEMPAHIFKVERLNK